MLWCCNIILGGKIVSEVVDFTQILIETKNVITLYLLCVFRCKQPTIILTNAHSLGNKKTDLRHKCSCRSGDFFTADFICISETWHTDKQAESDFDIDGFQSYRCDRFRTPRHSRAATVIGGGVAVYINEKFCSRSDVQSRETYSDADYELLTLVILKPATSSSRNPGCICLSVVYIPRGQQSNVKNKVQDDLEARLGLIEDKIKREYNNQIDVTMIVVGDFNNDSFKLKNYSQFVTCYTREKATLDLMFCKGHSVPYVSERREPLQSDDGKKSQKV